MILAGGGTTGDLVTTRAWQRRLRLLGTYLYHLPAPRVTLDELASRAPAPVAIVEEV